MLTMWMEESSVLAIVFEWPLDLQLPECSGASQQWLYLTGGCNRCQVPSTATLNLLLSSKVMLVGPPTAEISADSGGVEQNLLFKVNLISKANI